MEQPAQSDVAGFSRNGTSSAQSKPPASAGGHIDTNALLVANTADSCLGGFYVRGGTNTLRANRARNATFGFHNTIAGTVLENNTATMSGSKFCDQFNNAILTGNNFIASESVCTL